MYSPKEKEIIERCLSISAWNYRVGKLEVEGKKVEASVFRGKVRKELLVLGKLVDDLMLSKINDSSKDVSMKRKGDGFFQKLIGVFSRGASI